MPTDSPAPSPAITTTPKVDVLRVRTAIQHRFNPVRLATPERMASELDALYLGHLTIARFWEAMQQRDDMIRVADGKRKDSVERMEFQVVVSDDAVTEANMELAQKQKEALGKFYNGLEATDVLRQDMRGGVGLLARQMLDARAKGWSVHEWIWRPRALDGQWTTATFRHCPLYWFENTTGQLRFKASDWDTYGVPMNPREWLVTVADNYMEAMTGAWLYKLDLVRAWVRFCERFGFPLPHAKTPAAKGSAEWDAVVESVEAINEDFAMVTNDQVELLLIEAKNTGSNVPFASLVERFDRMIPVIILGSDLSTMSAGSGQGQGASLQAKDDAKREQADACLLSETLQRKVDPAVIEYVFGPGVPVLVKAMFIAPKQIDVGAELQVDQFMVQNGVELSKEDFRERYGREKPDDGDELLVPVNQVGAATGKADGQTGVSKLAVPAVPDPADGQALANDAAADPFDAALAAREHLMSAATREAAQARAEDLLGVARELGIIMEITDPAQMQAALQRWLDGNTARARRLLEQPTRLAPALEQLLSSALLNGIETVPTKTDTQA